jgi:flagellar biosynthesis chaperone FliJ
VRERERAVLQAQQDAFRARQKRRALELYRDRMWQAYRRDAARAEQKAIDELATLRFVALRAPSEGDVT